MGLKLKHPWLYKYATQRLEFGGWEASFLWVSAASRPYRTDPASNRDRGHVGLRAQLAPSMSAEEEKKEEPTKVADAEVRSPHSQASDSARSRAHGMWARIMQERSARMELVRTQKPLHPRRRLSRKRRLRRSRWSSGPTRCATLAVLVCLARVRGRRFGGAGWPTAAAH